MQLFNDMEIDKDWSRFGEKDPFNDNYVEGYICRGFGDTYGSLFITKVNGEKVPQVIYCTPKIHYPFDQQNNWHFPKAKKILAYVKKDGCFNYKTRILLANGTKRTIGSIVNNKEHLDILTYDDVINSFKIGKIIEHHKYLSNKSRVTLIVEPLKFHKPFRNNKITCTEDHEFLTPEGWKQIKELKIGDIVYRIKKTISDLMNDFLVGSILGDASIWLPSKDSNGKHIGNPSIRFQQSEKQKQYLDLKLHLLQSYSRELQPLRFFGGYSNTPQWRFTTKNNSAFLDLYDNFVLPDGKRVIPENIGKYLSPLALAIWFMDDGSSSITDKQRPRCKLHMEGYSIEDVKRAFNALNLKYNISGSITNRKGPVIEMDTNSSDLFYKIVSPYIPQCLHYKIPKEYQVSPCILETMTPFYGNNNNFVLAPVKIISICSFIKSQTTDNYVYDLTLDTGHSYFADGILAHNSNLFEFRYQDSKEHQYVSWKTRLLPFVGNSKFGPFQDMLKEMLKQNPSIFTLPIKLGMNLSWELYGARNPHLIKYNIPLALSLLFARKGSAILPPSEIDVDKSLCVPLIREITKDYIYNYEEAQKELESNLKADEEGHYTGEEGQVWYCLLEDNSWVQFKCKPSTIEAIHWASRGISKNVIFATCKKAFESFGDPTIENVRFLLSEDYPEMEIEKIHYSIEKHLNVAKADFLFRSLVLEKYRNIGLNILTDKTQVLRALSKEFAKNEMKRVYSVVISEAVQ